MIQVDEETGEPLFDPEFFTPQSFSKEMKFYGRCGFVLESRVLAAYCSISRWGASSSDGGELTLRCITVEEVIYIGCATNSAKEVPP
jgi:hypothetical protein